MLLETLERLVTLVRLELVVACMEFKVAVDWFVLTLDCAPDPVRTNALLRIFVNYMKSYYMHTLHVPEC